MLVSAAIPSRGAFRTQIVTTAFALLLLVGQGAGQRAGNQMSQGNHQIEVHLTDQKGQPLNVTAKVQVLTNEGLRMAEAYSNREQGVAEFDGFNDGYYQLQITGPDIQTTTVAFQIPATEATHREYVMVEIKNSSGANSSVSAGSDPTVSAQDLAVPEKARAEFDKGMDAYGKGDKREAEDDLQQALSIFPNYVRAHNNLGVLYLQEGLKTKAFAEFSKAVEFDPKFAPSYLNLARISFSDGDYAGAEAELKKALAASPSFLNAMVLLCKTEFARKEFSDSLQVAKHVHQLTQDTQYAEIHLISGEILVSHGQNRDAVREYQMFVTENPTDSRVPKVKSLIQRLSAN